PPPGLSMPFAIQSTAEAPDKAARPRRGEANCATRPALVRYRRVAITRSLACAVPADQPPARALLPMPRRRNAPARPSPDNRDNPPARRRADTKFQDDLPWAHPLRQSEGRREYLPDQTPNRQLDTFHPPMPPPPPDLRLRGKKR